MRKQGRAVVVMMVALGLWGCAHREINRNLDAKLQNVNQVTSSKDLGALAATSFDQYPSLSAEQKAKLSALRSSMAEKMAQYRQESLNLRAQLIKDVADTDYNDSEIMLIESRLKKLENKRLKSVFSAVDETNRILGRDTNRARIMKEMFNFYGAADRN